MKSPAMPQASRVPQDLPVDEAGAWLSALADGQADALPGACKAWREDAQARRTWHAYDLIGDVLRSEELAHAPDHDQQFLAGLRKRLAAEPALLAPAPPVAATPRRQPWMMPAAVAAGFVLVAGVLVVTRMAPAGTDGGAPALAAASAAAVTTLVSLGARPASGALRGGEAVLIRDARLDEYLRAHQSARGGVAMAAPGGLLRQVDTVAPAGAQR